MTDKAPDAFRTISEAAEELDIPQHVLRFWETRFPQIKPLKRGGGRRYYRPEDVDLLRGIRYLLYAEGYTIKGVLRILKEHGLLAVQDSWKVQAEWRPESQGALAALPAPLTAGEARADDPGEALPEAVSPASAVDAEVSPPPAAPETEVEAAPAAFLETAPRAEPSAPKLTPDAPSQGLPPSVSIIRGGLKRQMRGVKLGPQPRMPLMAHEGVSRTRSRRAQAAEPLVLSGDARGALQAALAVLTAMRKILDGVRKR